MDMNITNNDTLNNNSSNDICDPFLWINSNCPGYWENPVAVFYSVLFVFILTGWMFVCSKQIKRLYRGGCVSQFGIYALLPFIIGGTGKLIFFCFHLAGQGTDLVPMPFMIWLSQFCTRFCIYGIVMLACFWRELYKSYMSLKIDVKISFKFLFIALIASVIILEGIDIAAWAYPIEGSFMEGLFDIHLIQWGLQILFLAVFSILLIYYMYNATLKTKLHERMKKLAVFLHFGTVLFVISNILKMVLWTHIIGSDSYALWFSLVTLSTVAEGIFIIASATFLRGGEILPKGLAFKYRPKVIVGVTIMDDGSKKIETKETGESLGKHSRKKEQYWTENDFVLAKELPIWKNPPKKFTDLFVFPSAIDENDARIKSAIIAVEIIVLLIIDYCTMFPYIYIYLVVSYASRFLFASRFNIEAYINLLVIRRLIEMKPHLIPSPPKRFSQFVGMCFALAYVILRIPLGLTIVANWIAAIHLSFALLESCFSVCAACAMFQLGMIFGVVPQDVCQECQIMFAFNDKPLASSSQVTSSTAKDLESFDVEDGTGA